MDFKKAGLAKYTPSATVCLDRRATWRDYSRQVAQCVQVAGLDSGQVARRQLA